VREARFLDIGKVAEDIRRSEASEDEGRTHRDHRSSAHDTDGEAPKPLTASVYPPETCP